jgi:hypothetical protein
MDVLPVCMYVCMYVCMCTMCMPGVLELLDLELQTVVSCHIDAGNLVHAQVSLFNILFLCVVCVCLCVCVCVCVCVCGVCVYYMCMQCLWSPVESVWSWSRRWLWAALWELKAGPLEKQSLLLTTEPSLGSLNQTLECGERKNSGCFGVIITHYIHVTTLECCMYT